MAPTSIPTASPTAGQPVHDPERLLGRVVGAHPGPTFIAVGGIHGNEPAGVVAARDVALRLAAGRDQLHGTFVAFAGNVGGLRGGQRYTHRDLNRLWNDDDVRRALDGQHDDEVAEYREVRGLWQAIACEVERASQPVFLVDCHTSSAAGVPFVLFGDTPAQHDFVDAFPIPVIEGLVEQVTGVLATYWTRCQGVVSCTVEGGQHQAHTAQEALAGALWLGLRKAGMLPADFPAAIAAEQRLDTLRDGLPRRLRVTGRHAITAADAFEMVPGFRNIDTVARGTLLAQQKSGPVVAAEDGVVVLPLYQAQGNDGFFWANVVDR